MGEAACRRAAACVIPTPRELTSLGEGRKVFRRDRVYHLRLPEGAGERLKFAASLLIRDLDERFQLHFNAVEGDPEAAENDVALRLDAAAVEPFPDVGGAREQAYVLESRQGAAVAIRAGTDIGCLYGVCTLLQLFTLRDGQVVLDDVRIKDYPDFRYRGNRWLLNVELGEWSYDRGDGIGAFRQRIVEKLDLSLKYKVNVIIFDAVGWGTDAYPEYAALMRELNREARLRGIHLMHTGYGTGIGNYFRIHPELYRGVIWENRRSYPDGAVYPCIGGTAYAGTCLTNEELMRLRADELARFVEEVQPGALYLHQEDEGLSPDMWKARCPECRERWPNDELAASDGMAGAFAYLYDRLAERVQSVCAPGYRAETDCLLMFVSPGYLGYAWDDAEWQRGLAYWQQVSLCMERRENIFFGFRELFYNHGNARRRVPEMAQALQDRGRGHGLGIIYFYGADGHYNDRLFLPTPMLNAMYLGAQMMLTASGHAYQEPLQLLQAEFMWNATGSRFAPPGGIPQNYEDFLALYLQCRTAEFRPAEIYAEGGFLRIACERLYGKDAGARVARLFLLGGRNGEPPIPYLKNAGLLRGEDRRGVREGDVFAHFTWGGDFVPQTAARIRERVGESLRVTREARDFLQDWLARNASQTGSREEIRWYRDSLASSERYLALLDDYLGLFVRLKAAVNAGPAAASEFEAIDASIRELRHRVEDVRLSAKRSRLAAVDYRGGALCGRDTIINFLIENLGKMQASIFPAQGS